MTAIESILSTELNLIIEDIRQGMDAKRINASGNLRRNIRSQVNEASGRTKGLILAPAYVFTIDTGRAPTRQTGPGLLKLRIRQWLDDKNVPLWPGFKDRDAQAFVIARKIHQLGTVRFRNESARNRILPEAIPDSRIQLIAQKIAQTTAGDLVQAIRQVSRAPLKI